MYKQRREFIRSFAEVGPMSAALLAMGAAGPAYSAVSRPSSSGNAIRGPYLDLTTPKGNVLALARMNGDLDESKQKHGWYKGYVMAVRPGKRVEDLIGFEGFDASRVERREDGSFTKLLREVVLYTDLKTGEVLEEWHNPYINETVKVVPVYNDPYNSVIAERMGRPAQEADQQDQRPPLILNWQQYGNRLDLERHVHLYYPNHLKPEKWVRESSGAMARVSEMYTYHVDAELMQDESLTTLPFSGTWHRITPWLPWMLMGRTPGFCEYACFHGAGQELEEAISRPVLDYIEKHYPQYFNAPEQWEEPSRSSLEVYASDQEPAPVKE